MRIQLLHRDADHGELIRARTRSSQPFLPGAAVAAVPQEQGRILLAQRPGARRTRGRRDAIDDGADHALTLHSWRSFSSST